MFKYIKNSASVKPLTANDKTISWVFTQISEKSITFKAKVLKKDSKPVEAEAVSWFPEDNASDSLTVAVKTSKTINTISPKHPLWVLKTLHLVDLDIQTFKSLTPLSKFFQWTVKNR